MSLTTRVLLGLLAGLALGIALASWLPAAWQPLAAWIEPIGTIATRALQLMVIQLVTTLLFTGVSAGGGGAPQAGRQGDRLLRDHAGGGGGVHAGRGSPPA